MSSFLWLPLGAPSFPPPLDPLTWFTIVDGAYLRWQLVGFLWGLYTQGNVVTLISLRLCHIELFEGLMSELGRLALRASVSVPQPQL